MKRVPLRTDLTLLPRAHPSNPDPAHQRCCRRHVCVQGTAHHNQDPHMGDPLEALTLDPLLLSSRGRMVRGLLYFVNFFNIAFRAQKFKRKSSARGGTIRPSRTTPTCAPCFACSSRGIFQYARRSQTERKPRPKPDPGNPL